MRDGVYEAKERRAAASPGALWPRLRRRAEFGDAVLLLYVVAVVRQCWWHVADNRASWAATVAVSILVWIFYVWTKPEDDARGTPAAFWPLVVLPLALVYAARVALPDTSFDVLNYHVFQGERSLRFPFFAPGDFFPVIVPFNPTPDIVHALTRRALGYRLGTIVNLCALVWAAGVAERMLRPFVPGPRLRCAGVLAAVWAEQLLFVVNNYMVDLLPLPLMLEATRLTLRYAGARRGARPTPALERINAGDAPRDASDTPRDTAEARRGATDTRRDAARARLDAGDARRDAHAADDARLDADGARREDGDARGDLLRVAFLLGLAVAFKITNLTAVVALAPLWAHRLFYASRPVSAKLAASLAAASVIFVLPILPYAIYFYRLTGSPLFPLYNDIFRSPYWGTGGGWDARWGPRALWEELLWPLMLPFVPGRFSELGIYSGRITLGFVAAAAALLIARRDSLLRPLCVVLAVGAVAWSFVIGYSRYGLHLEVVGGVIVVALLAKLTGLGESPARIGESPPHRRAFAAALCLALAAQLSVASYRIWRTEWSLRPVALRSPGRHADEAAYLLRDRSLRGFLAPAELAKVDQVDVWIECGTLTSGIAVMLRPDAPAVGVRNYEFFTSRAAVDKYLAALDRAASRRMYALAHPADAASCAQVLKDRGLLIAGSTPLRVPYYSPHNVFEMSLLEIRRGELGELLTAHLRQLPLGGYRARIVAPDAPAALRAGERVPLRVRVSNAGASAWPAGRPEGGAFQVNLGGRWLRSDGTTPVREVASRTTLPRDIQPGEELELTLLVDAPAEAGDYVLQIDMVHEAVTWFYQQDSAPLLLKVRVGP